MCSSWQHIIFRTITVFCLFFSYSFVDCFSAKCINRDHSAIPFGLFCWRHTHDSNCRLFFFSCISNNCIKNNERAFRNDSKLHHAFNSGSHSLDLSFTFISYTKSLLVDCHQPPQMVILCSDFQFIPHETKCCYFGKPCATCTRHLLEWNQIKKQTNYEALTLLSPSTCLDTIIACRCCAGLTSHTTISCILCYRKVWKTINTLHTSYAQLQQHCGMSAMTTKKKNIQIANN